MPLPTAETKHEYDDSGKDAVGFGFAGKESKFKIETQIAHQGEVNRARYMPQQYSIIATQTPSAEIHIFDYFKHPSKPESPETVKPELKLVGQKKEGYGLSWNPLKKGILLGASHDGTISTWNIESAPQLYGNLEPLATYSEHIGAVEDVAWSRFHPEIFVSGGDDKRLLVWDTRKENKKPIQQIEAHSGGILSVDFNPFNENVLATASVDKTIAIWDIRNFSSKQYSLKQHQDEVSVVTWAPFNEALLASASQDRRVFVWDLSRIGKTQTAEEAADGPPELLFIHGGHTSKISDISWNPNEDLVMASVADDNVLQTWQIVFFVVYICRLGKFITMMKQPILTSQKIRQRPNSKK